MSDFSFRRDFITKPIFRWARHVLPSLSDTEREAIEAGDVWWDADLFTGNPDWAKLLAFPPAKLTAEEQAFLDGPVDELCRMLDDWQINWELGDLPPEVWDFLKAHKFFAMIIPKKYGGLEFSAYAHSEVIRKLSTRSICAAVTAMVPNSLGPGELLLQFGTTAQQDYWLPRLAEREARFPASGSPARRPARTPPRWWIPAWSAAAPGRAARCSASGSTGTSATSRSGRSRPCWASPSSSTIPII